MENRFKFVLSQLDAKAMRGQKKLQYKPTAIHQLSQKSSVETEKNNFINFRILTADWSRCHALVESALLLWNVQN